MKNVFLSFVIAAAGLLSLPAFAQSTTTEPEALGLPGDNLNLYAVLELFQKSKTIEDFEKSLNEKDMKINNLDLNNDKEIDFIKVKTEKDGDDFIFILQIIINKNEIQDVAVINVNKSKDGNVTVQIIGDKDLYGKNYIVEADSSEKTANPGYKGNEKVIINDTSTTTYVYQPVTAWPVVTYIYSPVYVPYYSPYYWGYYPPYWHPWAPVYYSAYWGYHGHYYGNPYYRRSVVVVNPHYYNNYYGNRSTSVTVNNYYRNGYYKNTYNGQNYRKPQQPSTRPSQGTRPTTPTTRPTTPTTRPTMLSTRPTTPMTRPTTPTTRPTTPTTRPTMPSTRPATPTTRPAASASAGGGGRRR